MIKLNSITKTYRIGDLQTIALDNISLNISKGEFVSITGPSGCGKSTLLNIIGLLDLPDKGEVVINNRTLKNFDDKQLSMFRNQNIGFVFQSYRLIPSLSVFDNIEIPLIYAKMDKKQRKERVLYLLDQVGLSHRKDHLPKQLSGGQCQRVAFARALSTNPKIILADEPTGNLDSKMGEKIILMLKELNQTNNTTIVMVTHNEEQSKQSQRIIRLFDGRIVY